MFVVAATTLFSCSAARMVRAVPSRSIRQAIWALIDWAGMFVIFLAANVALGAAVILLIRGFTPHFVTLYTLESVLLLVLSAAQAFIFQISWRRE